MKKINSIIPRDKNGHQFVVYADSCSGIPHKHHAANLCKVNLVLMRLKPEPEFICFPGDEISGLTNSREELLHQWNYWHHTEMAWIKDRGIPIYNTTGNHTTYNVMSENVFRQVFSHFPQNGPKGQEGLSYFIKKKNLLMVFVNTLWSGLGGEARVETDWLETVLSENHDAAFKLVFGHHPVYPVNGFSGECQRTLEAENGQRFWEILKRNKVNAYFCSHILAFDVQIHNGVLQILTAGAGTHDRMPKDYEYLHLIQAAIDSSGIRYQVIDQEGKIREWLNWPGNIPVSNKWGKAAEEMNNFSSQDWDKTDIHTFIAWEFSGISPDRQGPPQTLMSGWQNKYTLPVIWIGLTGEEQRITVYLCPKAGQSPHHWYGPPIPSSTEFTIQIAIHNGMGPGGILWRWHDNSPWTSLKAASPWGAERLNWPVHWSIGSNYNDNSDACFRGSDLQVKCFSQSTHFKDILKKRII